MFLLLRSMDRAVFLRLLSLYSVLLLSAILLLRARSQLLPVLSLFFPGRGAAEPEGGAVFESFRFGFLILYKYTVLGNDLHLLFD